MDFGAHALERDSTALQDQIWTVADGTVPDPKLFRDTFVHVLKSNQL